MQDLKIAKEIEAEERKMRRKGSAHLISQWRDVS